MPDLVSWSTEPISVELSDGTILLRSGLDRGASLVAVLRGASPGDEINIGGTYVVSEDIRIPAGVTLVGPAVILCTGAARISLAGPNIILEDLVISRSGTNPEPVLSAEVSSFQTILDGLVMRNVEVTNISGMACGTWHGDAYGCHFRGIIAIDYLYGGRLYDCEVEGHDPALAATSYGIKTAQAIADFSGIPSYTPDESARERKSLMCGGRLINTDPNGVGINGVTEDPVGDRLTRDWFANGASGASAVSWYPVPLIGVYILGPQPRNTAGVYDQGSIDRDTVAGTGGALRGTLRLLNCEVYGFHLASYLHDSDIIGGMWATEVGTHQLMKRVISCSFVGVSFIFGSFKLGTTDGLRQVQLDERVTFSSCHFQGNTEALMEGCQHDMHNCDEAGFDGINNLIGWNQQAPIAARFNGTSTASMVTADTADYSLTTSTFECWFRCDNSQSAEAVLFAYPTATGYTLPTINASTGLLYAYVGGALIANVSGLSFADSSWHHLAITISGGTGTLYLDGISKGSAAIVAMTGSAGLRIGASQSAGSPFKGDIAELRISSNSRYAGPFTPTKNWIPDSNTVSLFSDSTRKAFGWTDRMSLHDADFVGAKSLAPNLPFWVLRDRSYLLQ